MCNLTWVLCSALEGRLYPKLCKKNFLYFSWFIFLYMCNSLGFECSVKYQHLKADRIFKHPFWPFPLKNLLEFHLHLATTLFHPQTSRKSFHSYFSTVPSFSQLSIAFMVSASSLHWNYLGIGQPLVFCLLSPKDWI